MLDFWATWCGWCIKSFPALRDLVRDYADSDLALVGVTAHAGYVVPHRYDLDDDLKDRAGSPPTPLRLARGASEEQKAAHQEKSLEVIGQFIRNHELTWDIVLIDEDEPSAKYALTGWPHAVVLDRQGRIRYFKSGALLRDRPEQVAKFRKILDALLAEK
jgi:thiol-disulfide isomerase/thioredoxin